MSQINTQKTQKPKEPRYAFTGGKKTVSMKINSLTIMRDASFNVAYLCRQLGIHRRSFSRWKATDKEYARACEDILEEIYDDAESRLQKNIHEEKDTSSLIFFLKTKCKHRGYVEKQEIEHTGAIPVMTKEEREEEIKRLLGK